LLGALGHPVSRPDRHRSPRPIDIFPVNYRLAGHDIAFRTNMGCKLLEATTAEVAFEVDRFDPESKTGWSVVIHGQATNDVLATDNDKEPSWTGAKSYFVRITQSAVSGRAIR
jgi:hypothetical protein